MPSKPSWVELKDGLDGWECGWGAAGGGCWCAWNDPIIGRIMLTAGDMTELKDRVIQKREYLGHWIYNRLVMPSELDAHKPPPKPPNPYERKFG